MAYPIEARARADPANQRGNEIEPRRADPMSAERVVPPTAVFVTSLCDLLLREVAATWTM